jgi:DNA-binding PadR family transcriptional regulator
VSGGQVEWSEGMLYPVLHRLEREKLIHSEWKAGPNGRERKYYSLKPDGRRALQEERRQWLAVHNTLGKLWNLKPASS